MLCLGDLVGLRRRPGGLRGAGGRAGERDGGRQPRARRPGPAAISSGSTRAARAAALWTARAARRGPPRLPGRAAAGRAPSRTRPSCTRARAIPRSGTTWSRPRTASQVFGDFATRLCFVGHSHLPGAWSLGSAGPDHAGRLDARAAQVRLERRPALHRQRRQRGPAARSRSARRLRDLGPRRARSSTIRRVAYDHRGGGAEDPRRGTAAGAGRSARPWSSEPGRSRRARAASLLVLALSGVLGALAFPRTDWSLLAWVWLVPALVLGLAARAARAALAGRLARGHRVLRRPPALARPHLPRTTARSPGRSRGCPSWRWPPTAALYLGALAAARSRGSHAGSAPGRALASRPRSGWRGSGCAGTSWAGFPGVCSGYSQHAALPVIQIAELGGVYAVSLADRGGERGAGRAARARLATGAGRAPRPRRCSWSARSASACTRSAWSRRGRGRRVDVAVIQPVDRADASSGIRRATPRSSTSTSGSPGRPRADATGADRLAGDRDHHLPARATPTLLERLRRLSADIAHARSWSARSTGATGLAGSSSTAHFS